MLEIGGISKAELARWQNENLVALAFYHIGDNLCPDIHGLDIDRLRKDMDAARVMVTRAIKGGICRYVLEVTSPKASILPHEVRLDSGQACPLMEVGAKSGSFLSAWPVERATMAAVGP